jgi:hypothetical protein
MNSDALPTNNPYKVYCLPVREEPCSVPGPTQELSSSSASQNIPKFSVFDTLELWLPAWAYGVSLGICCLIGLALAIVFFGFALYFIIARGPSLF